MTDKNEPKIRIVTLDKKSVTENNSNKGCHCDDDDNCPECRVQPITCDCDPQCHCDSHKKKQQQSMKGKERHRTFFKIGENKISD